MWCNILEEFNQTQKYFLTERISLDKTIQKLVALKFLVENISTKNYVEMGLPTEKLSRKLLKRMMPREEAKDEALTLKQELRCFS